MNLKGRHIMEQANRYLFLQQLRQGHEVDNSYRAAFYLLSSTSEAFEIAKDCVNHEGIDFTEMKRLAEYSSEMIEKVVDIAHNLFSWNSKCSVTPTDMANLEYPYLEKFCEALYIAGGQCKVLIPENENGNPEIKLDYTPYRNTVQTHKYFDSLAQSMGENQHDTDVLGR